MNPKLLNLKVATGLFGLTLLSSAHADQFQIQPGNFEFTHVAGQNVYPNIALVAKKYLITEEWVNEPVTYYDYICDQSPGDGKGDWKNYFNVGRLQKPEALHEAILGLSLKNAKEIVESGDYFTRKPRSWNAFKKEVKAVQEGLQIKGFYHEIIAGENGKANAANLGYIIEGNCQWVSITEDQLTYKSVSHYVADLETQVQLRFGPSKVSLLNGESEKITLSYNGNLVTVSNTSTYNNYAVSPESSRGTIILTNLGRKAIAPSLADFALNFAKDSTGRLTLSLQDARSEELQRLGQGSYKVNVRFSLKKYIDSCWHRDATTLNDIVASFDNGTGTLDLNDIVKSKGQNLESGAEYYLENISFERVNTPYFAPGATSSIIEKSDKVKY